MKEEAIAAKTASPGSEDRHSLAPIRSNWSWYVVHTKPRQEGIALENLERQGYCCYLPRLWVQKVRRGKAQLVQEALFARYLFIHLDSSHQGQSWTPIRSTLGVAQLVRFGTQPAKVDDALIELLRAREAQAEPQALFAAGDAVIVTEGPFAGLQAVYQTQDAEHRALILLEILSKPTAMRIEAGLLRKVPPAG